MVLRAHHLRPNPAPGLDNLLAPASGVLTLACAQKRFPAPESAAVNRGTADEVAQTPQAGNGREIGIQAQKHAQNPGLGGNIQQRTIFPEKV